MGNYSAINADMAQAGENIVNAAHEAGATCAIGFIKKIDCIAANSWTERFCSYYADGTHVRTSAYCAQQDLYAAYLDSGSSTEELYIDSYYIAIEE